MYEYLYVIHYRIYRKCNYYTFLLYLASMSECSSTIDSLISSLNIDRINITRVTLFVM